MPLLRYSLYSQNVNLYLAPTADFRETWLPLMRTVAFEGRTVVLSANQCLKKKSQPEWIRSERKEGVAKFNGIQGLHGINGEYIKKRTSSTTKTHDSHEAAGPSPKWRALEPKTNGASGSSAVIEAEIDEPELPPGLTRNRRKSTITKTEDNHEICWPACKDKDSKPETIDVTSDAIPGSSPLRQSMTAPVDENVVEDDGNENGSVLTENRPRRASLVTRTEDNHEISWPPCGEKKRASRDAAVSKGTPIDKTTIEEANGEDDTNGEDDANSEDDANEFVSRGGSCIISPMGEVLAGPLWDVDEGGLLVTEVDFDDCERGKLDLDVAGHYSRSDAFKLTVEGLDLNPPP
jgi:nitrilase